MGVRLPADLAEFDELFLTKRQAAREQLDQAIELLFRQEHYIATNTLAWAALDVLVDIARKNGSEPYRDALEQRIKPQHRDQWRSTLKRAYNFAKHADRDPSATIDGFRPETTTWTIMEAVFTYAQIYDKRSLAMFIYQMWFMSRYPDFLDDSQLALASNFASGFGSPNEKPFRESTADALEFLVGEKQHGMMLNALTREWRELIED